MVYNAPKQHVRQESSHAPRGYRISLLIGEVKNKTPIEESDRIAFYFVLVRRVLTRISVSGESESNVRYGPIERKHYVIKFVKNSERQYNTRYKDLKYCRLGTLRSPTLSRFGKYMGKARIGDN